MSSIPGLPTQHSDVTVFISSVHLNPLCVLVEFWGKFSEERTADYRCLAKEIQSPGNIFQEFEGNPGDQCLAQVDGSWYRSRIVSKNGLKYSVFLFDKGRTHSTTRSQLAWGEKNYFHLPPEVEFCVLANVLPLSPDKRWSPGALEFLKSLSGKSMKAHVQDLLVLHRTFLLHIPCISKQMYEMGLVRKLSPDMFQDFVLMSLQSHSGMEVSPENQISMAAGEQLHKKELFMYPELAAGSVETVIVTEVTNPQRMFCQLNVFSQELRKLSGKITQCCEGRIANCIVSPEMIGFPCATKGSDGKWYRSVLQQVCSNNKVVEVLNVDYGTKRLVQMKNVRPLASEFFRMPVVTYNCSLHGIIDKGVGWTTSQIDFLKNLLLHKTVIAKFEYQSISEGVHYVTLYGEDNISINKLFSSKESCFLESEKTLGDYAICNTASSCKHPAQPEIHPRKMLTDGQTVEGKEWKGILRLPTEELSLNSSHVAAVHHIADPSEFWIQTQSYADKFDELMDNIYHRYKDSDNIDMVSNPTVGLYCAAKAEDGEFYRATVAESSKTQVKVFFVDYGNTEVVDRSNIRTLPDEFKKLPCLSLKCSLAGVGPKDGKWSQSACEFFIKAVKDKDLTVHVIEKYGWGYVVQLTDPKAQGERDLSTLMYSSGHAETQRQLKTKMTTQPAIPPQLLDARLSGVYSNKGMSFQTTVNTVAAVGKDKQIPTFKEHMFPIGSVIDVRVSHIGNPNDFWCQQVQNTAHLKLLMHDIQAQYAGSEFQPNVEMACIARHPDNQLWYRALVICKRENPQVDVLFVDYGQTETVSLYDLRRISPQFLSLQGQAFRCSLLNPVDPMSAINEWNGEAIAKFHSFVETAASNFVILKCTIYAVMYSEQKIVFNIVDLETPFESVCTSIVNLAKSAPPKKTAGPSFRLDTYYYSTHNIKTGTEEQVTVTCVNNVDEFYCHLEKNADVIKDLKIKVGNLCHQLRNVKLPTVFGTLCFAKYTDGHWYRGQIKATKPAILVHLVDYGETIEVEKSDLLPVPREASDIMSVPVQAVLCSLSDVPANVPTEMNSWFETSATDCKFRALVVAREPDGKLQVELYHANTKVNSKIKKMFQTEKHTAENVVPPQSALKAAVNHSQKIPKVVPEQAAEMQDANMSQRSALKTLNYVCGNGRKFRHAPFKCYIPPHKRQTCRRTPSTTEHVPELTGAHIGPRKESLSTETKPLESKSLGTEFLKESVVEKSPELADLPSNSITSDLEADVYVSHCNSPSSFYVQLVRQEDDLFSLAEKLNDPQSTSQTNIVKDLHPGDLVQAEFADDSSWYRAVVREIHGKTMALVEFVDFGNTAMVPISKIGLLQKTFLQLPSYSTHCMLNEASGLGKEKVLDPKALSAFKENIGSNGEKVLKCHFLRQSGSVWEVRLKDYDGNVMFEVPPTCSTDDSEIASNEHEQAKAQPKQIWQNVPENSDKSPPNSLLRYHQEEMFEGQKLEVYITSISDALTFWCQLTDSEDLENITLSVSKVVDADSAELKHIHPDSISPGRPCIALFSDDGFWYRAEVIDREEDRLSVLFVDYGNKIQVNFTDLREIPPYLTEIPQLAFLCELDGFDASHGSWQSGAVDALVVLTTDKVLQLTVTRVMREAGKIKCLVQLECEGQVINEALKTWWKSTTTKIQPGAFGLAPPCQTHLQSKEQSIGELDDPHADVLPCDGGINETRLPNHHNKDAQGIITLSCNKGEVETDKGVKEEKINIIGPDDLNSPLNENPPEAIDESLVVMAGLKSLSGEVPTYSMESSIDIHSSDLIKDGDDRKVIMAGDKSLISTTTVKMVSRKAFWPEESVDLLETHVHISEDSKQIQAEVVVPYCVLPAFDVPSEQKIDIGDGVPEAALACVTAPVENDLMTAEDNVAHHEDGYSVLPFNLDTAAIETQTCTAPLQDLGDGFELATCSFEVATCSVEDATCSVEDATGSVEEATCSVEEATCSVEEATCSVEEATCSVEEATCSVEEATCSVEEATCSVEEATCSVEEATCSVEEATCSVEEATCSVEEATCSVEEATCSVEEATCSVEAATCSVEAATCSVEAATCSVEEPTCSVEDATCSVEEPTRSSEEPTRSSEEPTRSVEEATRPVEDVACSSEEAACSFEDSFEEATCSFEDATCSFEDSFEEATCSIEEATCSVEEGSCLTDDSTDEPNDDWKMTSARDDRLSSTSAEVQHDSLRHCGELQQQLPEASSQHERGDLSLQEEADHNKNEDEASALHQDHTFARPADTEPQENAACCPDLTDLIEEVTCLVEENCQTDVCRGPPLDEQQTASQETEQLALTPPSPREDFTDGVLKEDVCSSADDSLEAQLSRLTHLSLIVNDGSAEVLRVEQQPEK
ncbi:tudor domain-containing 6 isoform X2 [Clinocottus analis]|uniref:tudor domain-containing 6 isoform X2 n=1 Tax=Clinocottus analis TaxID=304258 RepID=UPI0035C114D4